MSVVKGRLIGVEDFNGVGDVHGKRWRGLAADANIGDGDITSKQQQSTSSAHGTRLVLTNTSVSKPSMPSKRLRSSTSPSNGDISDQGRSKRVHAHSLSPTSISEGSFDRCTLKVHIISAKLEPNAIADLVDLVERLSAQHGSQVGIPHLELTADLDLADVIVTAVHTRPRLERHISWEVAVRRLPHLVHTLR